MSDTGLEGRGGRMGELYDSELVGLSIVVRCLTASVNDI